MRRCFSQHLTGESLFMQVPVEDPFAKIEAPLRSLPLLLQLYY